MMKDKTETKQEQDARYGNNGKWFLIGVATILLLGAFFYNSSDKVETLGKEICAKEYSKPFKSYSSQEGLVCGEGVSSSYTQMYGTIKVRTQY